LILPTLAKYEIITLQNENKVSSIEENFTAIMDKYKDLVIALSSWGSIQIKAVEQHTGFSRPAVKEILKELTENNMLRKYPTFWAMPATVKVMIRMRFFGKSMMDSLHNKNIKPVVHRNIKLDTRSMKEQVAQAQQEYESQSAPVIPRRKKK
jgi:hypothetical protein